MSKWGDVRVSSVGPRDAKIVLIGESPGATEVTKLTPFVGGAGKILDGMLEEAGILREDCYITNVSKYRPAGDDFGNFYEDPKTRKQATPFLDEQYGELATELQELKPNVIVPLGNEALKFVTNRFLTGITNWRGSILPTVYGKIVPTYHPAAVLRQWSWRPISVIDLVRAKEQSTFPEIRQNPRTLHTNLGFDDLIAKLAEIKNAPRVSFDIETESGQIQCISFATSRSEAVCVPFWFGASGSLWAQDQELILWELVRDILEGPSEKIAQNGQYDMYYLIHPPYNIRVNNLWMDTMIAAHVIYPELPKGLDFLCSVYTDQPYYKHLGATKDMYEFYKYNALDAIITYEVAEELEKEMRGFGVWDFYHKHSHPLIQPLFETTLRGVRIDLELMKTLRQTLKDEVKALEEQLVVQVGHELNVNSNKQMTAFLYDELKIPKKYKGRKATGYNRTVTADEDALTEINRTHKVPAIDTILDIRERKKLLSTYLEVKLDEDKRIRTSYLITGTETGRLSSRSTPVGTGTNLQNIPTGALRKMFVPDPGRVFVSADLSQAEARVVAYLANESRLIEVFSAGGDIHRRNAANIFGIKEEAVTKEQRTLAKRITHASNYGMGPLTFAKHINSSLAEAKKLLNQYFATYPGIKLWHMDIAQQLRRSRILVTPLGRKRQFFNTWNESLLKEAYAFVPQSTVSDILNDGLIEFCQLTMTTGIELMLQVHDSIVVQCSHQDVTLAKGLLKQCLERPTRVNGRVMVIPADIKEGKDWSEL